MPAGYASAMPNPGGGRPTYGQPAGYRPTRYASDFRPTDFSGLGKGIDFRAGGGFGPSGVTPARSLVGLPSLGDYLGGLGTAPRVPAPMPTHEASRAGIGAAVGDVNMFRAEYNAPTASAGFATLMSLAGETTGAAENAARREGGEAASRAGYAGGFDARGEQAAEDRMKAVASAGFEGAREVRGQALQGYGIAESAATALITAYNMTKVQEAMANADRQAQASAQQAMLDLQHMGMGMQAHQAYAGAKSEAQRLQAQLDSHFQDQRIDAARYLQMSASIQANFVASMARLSEESKQFAAAQQLSYARLEEQQTEFGATNALTTRQTIDPRTGLPYNVGAPRPGAQLQTAGNEFSMMSGGY